MGGEQRNLATAFSTITKDILPKTRGRCASTCTCSVATGTCRRRSTPLLPYSTRTSPGNTYTNQPARHPHTSAERVVLPPRPLLHGSWHVNLIRHCLCDFSFLNDPNSPLVQPPPGLYNTRRIQLQTPPLLTVPPPPSAPTPHATVRFLSRRPLSPHTPRNAAPRHKAARDL